MDNWIFEPEKIQGKKTPFWGAPYTATVSLTFVNGECHVTTMLAKTDEEISRADIVKIENEILKHGYDQYTLIRFKKGKPFKKVYKIKR